MTSHIEGSVVAPWTRAVAFTGSTQGGRALAGLAAARPDPIPFYGELGGVNPVFITPHAARMDWDLLGRQLATSVLQGSGQFCTKPGLIFVPAGADAEGLRLAFAETIRAATSGRLLGASIVESFRIQSERISSLDRAQVLAVGTGFAGELDVVPMVLAIPGDAYAGQADEAGEEVFGPFAVIVDYESESELVEHARGFTGCLTMTVIGDDADATVTRQLYRIAERRAGRILGAGVPTGVIVSWAQQHGGPWPATTSSLHTSVGAGSIERFLRPIAYQDVPTNYLPAYLRDDTAAPVRIA